MKIKSEDHSNYLELLNIKRFDDNSGYISLLNILSKPFSAQIDFYFEEFALKQFYDQLLAIDLTLSGEAILKPMWEPQFIKFEIDSRGHVTIKGELYSGLQKLTFEFKTDQTYLKPFISDLSKVLVANIKAT